MFRFGAEGGQDGAGLEGFDSLFPGWERFWFPSARVFKDGLGIHFWEAR